MKAIVRRSAAVVTFVGLLGLTLSAPQLQHVERCADLLVVAPRRKTLAQLAALELPGIDPSNLADFFRISGHVPVHAKQPRATTCETAVTYDSSKTLSPKEDLMDKTIA